MRLLDALRYSKPACIAFVGAGGKTTAIFTFAREILAVPANEKSTKTVLVTTTTHLGAWQTGLADRQLKVTSIKDLQALRKDLPGGIVLISGEESNHRLNRLPPVLLDEVRQIADDARCPLLIEADGAHLHPLKAPAEHEPVIPEFSQHVVVVAGLAGLGKPLTKDWVHRVDQFEALSGLRPAEEITPGAICKVLLHKRGGLKKIPCGARKSVILNQADTPELQSQAKRMGEQLISAFEAGIVASLSPDNGNQPAGRTNKAHSPEGIFAVIEPIAGIILAAGESRRFGKPKLLLPWKGQPMIRHVASAALQAGLAPVVVVVGSSANEIQEAINDMPLRIVNNVNWADGVSSSIRAGLSAITRSLGGAVFLQGDQPQIPPILIRSLVEAHQSSLRPIIAPQIDGKRGTPVLFDVDTFNDLLALEGDVGGRVLFGHYPVEWLVWHDAKLLIDIDTAEDYERFLKTYPQNEGQV